MKEIVHKLPKTDEERIADGQRRFEYYDSSGHCIFYCYRHKLWQANRAMKYHARRMAFLKEKREAEKASMNEVISAWKKKMERDERVRLLKAGITDINKVTFFDLLEADETQE